MHDELVELLERAGIEQQIDALPGRELARRVLTLQTLTPAPELRPPFEIGQNVV